MIQKKIIILTVVLLSFNLYSQVDEINSFEPVTVNRVKDMAVYPGCKQYKGDKKALIKCFGTNFQKDILRFLDTEFPDTDKPKVMVLVKFVVNTEGYIENVTVRGDDIFKPQAIDAVNKTVAYLKAHNKKIEPARMSDGNLALLIFSRVISLQNPSY